MIEEELKVRLKVANDEVARLARENQTLRDRNRLLEQLGKQWETDKIIQVSVIQQTLSQKDVQLQQLGEEINQLREEIRKLKNANIN